MTNADLDEEIAKRIFGCTQEQIDAWPFGVPRFSEDRNAAADVVSRVWAFDGLRQRFERHLAASAHLHGGIAEALLVCLPENICHAALKAISECGFGERCVIPDTDDPRRDGETAVLDGAAPSQHGTPTHDPLFACPGGAQATI